MTPMAPELTASTSAGQGYRQSTGQQSTTWPRRAGPVLIVLLAIDLLLFAGGATAHRHIPIPLGFATWVEPFVLPASFVEGIGAVGLAAALIGIVRRTAWAARLAWWVLWYCFAGVLWGMARLAMGSIPEARTMTNDFLHIGMMLVTTTALVRLAGRRA
jgi:hypothetical protein